MTLSTSTPWQPQSMSTTSCTWRGIQICFHTTCQTFSSLLARWPTCPQPPPHFPARRQSHDAPLLHPVWTIQEVVTEEYRILGSVNYDGTHTPAAWIRVPKQRLCLWCQQQFQLSQRPLFSLVPADVLPRGAQDIARVYVSEQPFTMDSRPTHVGGSACFLSCAFWICLQVAGVCLR